MTWLIWHLPIVQVLQCSQVDPVLYGQMMMKDHFVREIVAQSYFMSCHKRFKLLISGCKQSGVQLDDVVLPTWAKGDPREFIRAHREVTMWAASWQNQQHDCAPSDDSDQPDQPGHMPSLIRVFAVHMKKAWVLSYPLSAQWRLWSDWQSFCWFCHEVAQLRVQLPVHIFHQFLCLSMHLSILTLPSTQEIVHYLQTIRARVFIFGTYSFFFQIMYNSTEWILQSMTILICYII